MQELHFVGSGPSALLGVTDLRQHSSGVDASMTLGAGSVAPDGGTAVGVLGVLVDEVMGYSIMASLPQGGWSVSTEIWIDVIGALPRRGEELTARATPVAPGSLSRAEVRDGSGRLVVASRQRGRAVPDRPAGLDPKAVASADPGSGVDRLDLLLGLRAEGDAQVLQVRREFANPLQMLHGGISLAASESAATLSRLERGSALQTCSVHIVHTRGVPLGSHVVFRPETRHAGRSLWVTDVVGTVADKVCTVATVTAQE